ncbi:DUF2513 domain-containing protein [Roseovarius sp. 217]|uniref:DUF2513 domain-containing protein n=1 Tax=Roseovarius sp. (strain 217) TaxID=314264 RepID=UPI0003236E3D|nr:DUF2513 domain-containing protein [Roseovarius sp. 217]
MKRNDDFLREMLIEFEEQEDFLILDKNVMGASKEDRRWQYHLNLLEDQRLVTPVGRGTYRMTASGHDFLEAIRDDGLWQKTKDAVSETGGNATLEILKTLAVGLLKKKISQHTGIDLG